MSEQPRVPERTRPGVGNPRGRPTRPLSLGPDSEQAHVGQPGALHTQASLGPDLGLRAPGRETEPRAAASGHGSALEPAGLPAHQGAAWDTVPHPRGPAPERT